MSIVSHRPVADPFGRIREVIPHIGPLWDRQESPIASYLFQQASNAVISPIDDLLTGKWQMG